jgi:ribonuclease HIII
VLERALMEKGRNIHLDQRTKAESDYAVAAASILARERFINWMDEKGAALGVELPRGASARVQTAAVELMRKSGENVLEECAKTHFKTAGEVLSRFRGET